MRPDEGLAGHPLPAPRGIEGCAEPAGAPRRHPFVNESVFRLRRGGSQMAAEGTTGRFRVVPAHRDFDALVPVAVVRKLSWMPPRQVRTVNGQAETPADAPRVDTE